ncbi:MAG: DUF1801 domain-containing protein [Arachidicoccus sp.]|nr:DUF1801 domain-containing protein [Arachidicoccus sp.]
MQSKANSVNEYINDLPKDRQFAMKKLREILLENLPHGFHEEMNYGMIGYVVPHSIYNDGYHCNPKLPLPFINIASQKNYIAFYHMAIYLDEKILKWVEENYSKYSSEKLDMGKGCMRFKKIDKIPFGFFTELVKKMTVAEWIKLYEEKLKK